MGSDKQYDGYESYDYLDPDDYEQFELPDMHAGFPAHEVPASEENAKRADRLATENVVVSLHEHPFYFPKNVHEDTWDYVREGRVHTAYGPLSRSNLDAVFDFHLDGLSGIHSKHGWKWDDIVHDVTMRACDVAHQDGVVRISSVEDIHRAHREGKVGLVPALESAAMIENELDRIELLYGMGIRLMGITYNRSNALGTGQGDVYERDGGLTAFGAEAVERMNKIGMAVSISHASGQTAIDVCDVSHEPVLDTHALAAGAGERGTPDEELKAIAETGGVIGVISSSVIPDIEYFMEHFEYLVDLVGIDHVAFGPDVLYGDHRGLLELLAEFYDVTIEDTEFDHVEGLENPTEAWDNIPRWLVEHGYSDEEIRKVLGGNVVRVLDEIWY